MKTILGDIIGIAALALLLWFGLIGAYALQPEPSTQTLERTTR